MLDLVRGANCAYCDEPLLPGDRVQQLNDGESVHLECLARMTLGSVAHIRQRCGCFIPGSEEGDPPGMTKREAARESLEAMRVVNRAAIMNEDAACIDCGGTEFHPGPRGGAAHNVMCARCHAKWWYCPPFTPERIDSPEDVFDRTQRVSLGTLRGAP